MNYDVIIIGGRIVGLASAYKIIVQAPQTSICILEKEDEVAMHQTGHNSGVIHSGIYYKPGSLKAQNCIQGYQELIDFCEKYEIAHEICGKIIVATKESELPMLQTLYERGIQNGLKNLKLLDSDEVCEVEPHVKALKGISVPQTGITDYKAISIQLKSLLENAGVDIKTGQCVQNIIQKANCQHVRTQTESINAKYIINCAGLYSDRIAKMTGQAKDLQIIPFRGEYFMIKPEKSYLVRNLVYPVPDPNFPFLGVHFTRMIQGGLEAGPNAVLAFKREGYCKTDINFKDLWEILRFPGFHKIISKYWQEGLHEMHRSWSKSAFTKALQLLVPEIKSEDLLSGGSGVRAQACDAKGNLSDDFLIFKENSILHICNAPSPAATSCLSIGGHVAEMYFKNV